MDPIMKNIQEKMEDYSRFIVTLTILSVYFYIGTIITVYFNHSGPTMLLAGLTIACLASAAIFTFLWKRCSHSLQKENQ